MDRIALGLTAVCVVAAVSACSPEATRHDSGAAQDRRVEVIQRIQAGEHGFEGPPYQIIKTEPLMVFFLTWTGSSPDPYCGYEYAEPGTPVEPDPLASGEGKAEDLGNGWYWLCAS